MLASIHAKPKTSKIDSHTHSLFPICQYYFVLQSLQKLVPSTTLYYKACTKHFPVLLCTTKLALTKHVPVLLCSIQSLHKGVGNCSSKTRSRRQSRKKTILKHFLKGFLKGKLLAPKLRKSADKSLSQPGCSHYNAFRSITSLTRISLRAWQHQMATIMQPFQCDLPPQLQETHRTTHTGTTTRCKTHRRNNSRQKRPQPQPPHRRGTFHRRLQPLYTEKHKVSYSGFLPNTKPMQHHAAIPMRSATTASRNAKNYAHRNNHSLQNT